VTLVQRVGWGSHVWRDTSVTHGVGFARVACHLCYTWGGILMCGVTPVLHVGWGSRFRRDTCVTPGWGSHVWRDTCVTRRMGFACLDSPTPNVTDILHSMIQHASHLLKWVRFLTSNGILLLCSSALREWAGSFLRLDKETLDNGKRRMMLWVGPLVRRL
jgi:hypothetical protein